MRIQEDDRITMRQVYAMMASMYTSLWLIEPVAANAGNIFVRIVNQKPESTVRGAIFDKDSYERIPFCVGATVS